LIYKSTPTLQLALTKARRH